MEALTSHKSDGLREARKTSDSVFDRIYKFYFNKKTTIALTREEEAVRERWDFAWKMLAGMYTKRQVVEGVIQKFDVRKSIAYDDVTNCMMLFGDPRNANKDAKRALAEEWIIKGIKKAWDDQDLDAYERLIGKFNKINQLEEENTDGLADLLKNLRPTQIVIVAKRDDLNKEIEALQKEVTLDINHDEE